MNKSRILFGFALLSLVPLTACGDGYKKSAGQVTYDSWNEGTGSKSLSVEGVDPSTFRVLVGPYGADKTHVYMRGTRVEGADPSTFQVMDDLYAYDRAHAYINGTSIAGASSTGFTVLGRGWSKDAAHVFYSNQRFDACDPNSFRMLVFPWATDNKCVYRNQQRLAGADPTTFVVLNDSLGKDQEHVYASDAAPISGADAATFTLSGGTCAACAHDKSRCYFDRHVVACKASP